MLPLNTHKFIIPTSANGGLELGGLLRRIDMLSDTTKNMVNKDTMRVALGDQLLAAMRDFRGFVQDYEVIVYHNGSTGLFEAANKFRVLIKERFTGFTHVYDFCE